MLWVFHYEIEDCHRALFFIVTIIKTPQNPQGETAPAKGGSGVAYGQDGVIMRKLFAFTAQAQSSGVLGTAERLPTGRLGSD